jgi:hypothetical protein
MDFTLELDVSEGVRNGASHQRQTRFSLTAKLGLGVLTLERLRLEHTFGADPATLLSGPTMTMFIQGNFLDTRRIALGVMAVSARVIIQPLKGS